MAHIQRNHPLRHAYVWNASHPTSSMARVAPPLLLPHQRNSQYPVHIPPTPRQASISQFQHQAHIPQNRAYVHPQHNPAYVQPQQNRGYASIPTAYVLPRQNHSNVHPRQNSTYVQPRQNRGYAGIPTAYVQPRQNHSNAHPRQNPAYMQPQENRGYVIVSEVVWRMVDMLLQEADMNVSQGAGIPTALHVLESLPNSVVLPPQDEVAECAICTDDMCQEDQAKTITKLPCDHVFHKDCIMLWLSNHNTCPLCRYKLPAEGTTPEA